MAYENITIEDIGREWEKYDGMSVVPARKKLSRHHVEDPRQSVIWNQEFIETNNKLRTEEVNSLHKDKGKKWREIYGMIIKYITKSVPCNEVTAERVYDFVSEQRDNHSSPPEFLDLLDDTVDLIIAVKGN